MNLGIFIVGAVTFLVSFVLFKISAFNKTKNDENSWQKLFFVFFEEVFVHLWLRCGQREGGERL